MIDRDKLPEDAADWHTIEVRPDSLPGARSTCPVGSAEILEFVKMESADTDRTATDRLVITLGAEIEDVHAWVWTYIEEDGMKCYVTCLVDESGRSTLDLAETNGLSPEQFILAQYYDEVYWSQAA